MGMFSTIKDSPRLKRLALRLLKPTNDHRPRLWVRWFWNPLKHRRGGGVIVRRRTRLDVFPFNNFFVGSKSIIEDFSTINNGVGHVIIGERSIIGMSNVIIGPVTIGNDVMLAQHVVISGLNHGYEDVSVSPSQQKEIRKEVIISDRVWIGANCVVTAGVKIGNHCVVGAGSVVTKDLPDFSVAVGNPAKVIKRYNFESGRWERVGEHHGG